MDHHLLEKVDELDEAIGNSAALPTPLANQLRTSLGAVKRQLHAALTAPSGESVDGADRHDAEHRKSIRQDRQHDVDVKGEGGYLPARRASSEELPIRPLPSEPFRI